MAEKGTCKKWLPKGFGFIEPEDGSADVFCHMSALPSGVENLKIGEGVTYDLTEDPKSGKMRAENVEGDGQGEEPDLTPREPRYDDRRGGGDRYGGGRDGGRDRGSGGRGGGYGGGRDRDYGGRSGGGRSGGDRGGDRAPGICYQFRDGNCRYGDRCRFSHEG